jgi:hypothetical protein
VATLLNRKQGHGALVFPEILHHPGFELAPGQSVEVTDAHLAALRMLDGVRTFEHEGALQVAEQIDAQGADGPAVLSDDELLEEPMNVSTEESAKAHQSKPRRKGR